MADVHVLLQYNGVWDANFKYLNFSIYGILIRPDCSFITLVDEIKKQVGCGRSDSSMEIKFSMKEGYQPMEIFNDMSTRFYFDLRKSCADVTRYPLCITLKNDSRAIVCANDGPALLSQSSGARILDIQDLYMAPDDDLMTYDVVEVPDEICVITNPMNDEVVVGQVYADKETLVSVMKNLSLRQKFQVKVYRSSSTRYSLICAGKECDWCMRSSSLNTAKLFKIREFHNIHTCALEERLLSQRHASYAVVGDLIKQKFTDPKRTYTPKDIIRDIKNDYGFDLNYMKAWRSKEKALEILRGNPAKSYAMIPSYLYMVRKTNPGSVTKLHKTWDNRYMYVYVALFSSIKGWDHCRPVVVVDGSFISSMYGGTLITASTQDGEGSILPLAYAVVDSENDASWEWFFHSFRETYGLRDGMCIISDRHQSIAHACAIVYPEVPHCICIYHLWNNIKVKFRSCHEQIGEVFFSLAKAYTVQEFDHFMGDVQNIDKRVSKYLFDIGYHKWSRAYAIANRSDIMTSNIAESINGRNKYARSLPIVSLLHAMFSMVRTWNCDNGKAAMGTFKVLTNKYENIMEANLNASLKMMVIPSSDYLFEVQDGVKTHVVCLRNRTCSCRRFQMDEMPCSHAHAVLAYNNMSSYGFFSPFYTKKNLVSTYEVPVSPIQDPSAWKIPEDISQEVVLPPNVRMRPGRPKKRRCKSAWENFGKKVRITCARCGKQGHNRKTCRNPPIIS